MTRSRIKSLLAGRFGPHERGRFSRLAGIPFKANPYKKSDQRRRWDLGWHKLPDDLDPLIIWNLPPLERGGPTVTLGMSHIKAEGATACPSCGTPVRDFAKVPCT